jgi:N-carbamoyl-L-amino-acid hydrolase
VTRLCADENDKKARDWFRDQLLALGADYKVNATGTQFGLLPGEDMSIPPIAMGSHLDTVATGGNFDGPLGVIGGLEVARSMKEQGIKVSCPDRANQLDKRGRCTFLSTAWVIYRLRRSIDDRGGSRKRSK